MLSRRANGACLLRLWRCCALALSTVVALTLLQTRQALAAQPLIEERPILVADAGRALRTPPAIEYESRFQEPRFDDYLQDRALLPIFTDYAYLHLEPAELTVNLPPEDFKELDEYSPRLTTSSLDANDQRSVVGGRILWTAPPTDAGRFETEGRLLWLCEYLQAPDAGVTAFFAPGDSAIYATQGLSYGNNWAMVGKRFGWKFANGLSVFAGFDAQFNPQQMFHIGSTGLRYTW